VGDRRPVELARNIDIRTRFYTQLRVRFGLKNKFIRSCIHLMFHSYLYCIFSRIGCEFWSPWFRGCKIKTRVQKSDRVVIITRFTGFSPSHGSIILAIRQPPLFPIGHNTYYLVPVPLDFEIPRYVLW
jgi:hypothetical protein